MFRYVRKNQPAVEPHGPLRPGETLGEFLESGVSCDELVERRFESLDPAIEDRCFLFGSHGEEGNCGDEEQSVHGGCLG
jgi:hypothetical protein